VLLVLRQTARTLSSPSVSFFPSVLYDPAILEGALHFLETAPHLRAGPRLPDGFVDWRASEVQSIYQASLGYARLALGLAELTGRCDPENAWVAGLLAPLGWLAVCAVSPEQARSCLADPAMATEPTETQRLHWGFTQAEIARRLLRRWRMPNWLAQVVGHLSLSVDVARTLGADPELLRVVQMAISLAQQQGLELYLTVGTRPTENAAALGLATQEQEKLATSVENSERDPWSKQGCESPFAVPLLRDLLSLAVESQRLQDVSTCEQLESDQDRLLHLLEQQQAGEADRLQALKLQALAEFSAGAAHEINNPLAVISGQAQYFLAHEAEPARQKALQTIINHAQRVHQVLTDLMQFARPPRPQRQWLDLPLLVEEALLTLQDLATQRRVQLAGPETILAAHVFADPRQVLTALECLLRNAVEAAPADGWARIRLEHPSPVCLEVIVEDSGPGPGPAERERLFDPFYSGRQAGRGRGLGLPTAWRLARENGGDVSFRWPSGGPTRFVLTLPCEPGGPKPTGGDPPDNGSRSPHFEKQPRNGSPIRCAADS
jgi:signal transduction histidine kinase